jgi:hypothetical protein
MSRRSIESLLEVSSEPVGALDGMLNDMLGDVDDDWTTGQGLFEVQFRARMACGIGPTTHLMCQWCRRGCAEVTDISQPGEQQRRQ